MQNEAKTVLNDFHPPIAILPCASLCPFVALQFQQMQHFAARKEEMQNEPNCQNDRCDRATGSRSAQPPRPRGVPMRIETPRGRGGYARASKDPMRITLHRNSGPQQKCKNEPNVKLGCFWTS
jgi:hypothetical protein